MKLIKVQKNVLVILKVHFLVTVLRALDFSFHNKDMAITDVPVLNLVVNTNFFINLHKVICIKNLVNKGFRNFVNVLVQIWV